MLAGIVLFIAIALAVRSGMTNGFDRSILLSMRHSGDLSPKGSIEFQEMARDVTALGGTLVLSLVTIATAVFLWLDGKGRMGAFVGISVLLGSVLSTLLKDLFQRARPELVPHGMHVSNASFPSGHSMLSAVTYLTLAALLARSHERRRLKVYFVVVAVVLMVLVGLSRLYLGVHWPTDVLGGWTAGSVWAIACWMVARWLQDRHRLEAEAEHTPEDAE